MAELKADVLVLGAGMVGVSAALHLQKRGRNVVLIDRHEVAGEETSYGNAGLLSPGHAQSWASPPASISSIPFHNTNILLRYPDDTGALRDMSSGAGGRGYAVSR
jgi:glycine/D-amino acid oxidase-like deaminating enzyme